MMLKRTFLAVLILLAIGALLAKVFCNKTQAPMLGYKTGPDYFKDWQVVDSFVNAGLPVEALNRVDAIRKKAIAANNYGQIIKALIYTEPLKNGSGERSQETSIAEVESEVINAPFPMKPLLQSMLAEMYWNYYDEHRWKILERTKNGSGSGPDIETWDASAFSRRVGDLYLQSLSNTDSLKRTSEYLFIDILHLNNVPEKAQATLYDFLATRALQYFSNTESELTQPADQFVMSDCRYLGPADDFLDIRVNTTDTFSHLPRAIQLMQDLTRFNMLRASKSALVKTELTRLNFAWSHITLPQKDSLYMLALQKLEHTYITDTASTLVGFEIAMQMNDRASQYSPSGDTSLRWLKKQALEKCEEVSHRFPYTTGAFNCNSLLLSIMQQSLSFKVEDVEFPNRPFQMLLSYSNTDSIYLRVVSEKDLAPGLKNEPGSMELLKKVVDKKPLKEWTAALRESGDYREHSTVLAMPPLNNGGYYLVASTNRMFNSKAGIVSYYYIQVSDLGYTQRSAHGQDQYWVYDRGTGKPLMGATIHVYEEVYQPIKGDYIEVLRNTLTTGSDGSAGEKKLSNNETLRLTIDYKNEHLTSVGYEPFYLFEGEKDKIWHSKMFFFLDRSIYRPGQTLHFKALCLSNKDDQFKIEKRVRKTVVLNNANGVAVARLTLTSNNYGTIAGSFTLPSVGLNGLMNLNETQYFRVEDYKRPQFEVTFNPVKNSFRLGEKVTVTGKAASYSGVPVSDATVLYHVQRQATFPYWYYWRPQPLSAEQEIISTHVKTDAKGEFKIEFTALADPAISAGDLPEYNYLVNADVTDLNGETQTNATHLTVGTVALRVTLDLPDNYSTRDTTQMRINTLNLNGEFEAAKGTIEIYQLKECSRLLRNRPWGDEPDVFGMSEAEFHQKFPMDVYAHEDRYELWEKAALKMDISFDTQRNKSYYPRDFMHWKQGKYLAELTTHDKFGTEVKVKKYFTVYDPALKEMPLKDLWWVQGVKTDVEPGGVASVMIGSTEKDVSVLYEVSAKGNIIHHEWITLNNEKRLIEFPVKEEYRGGVTINFRMAKDNRFFNTPVEITVPFTNKDLKMEFTTFRDKMKPGGKEEWRVKISGPKGEKVAAEMLATMYDASLDAFAPNAYSAHLYDYNWSYDNSLNAWAASIFLGSGSSTNMNERYYAGGQYHYPKSDELNWFITSRYMFYRNGGSYTYEWETIRPTVRFVEMLTKKDRAVRGGSWKNEGYLESEERRNYREGSKDFKFTDNSAVAAATYGLAAPDKEQDKSAPYPEEKTITQQAPMPPVVPRTNFSETAFFYPQLQTDTSGSIIFSFNAPEALTRWKFLGMAHTQELQFGYLTANAVTQKDLMINTNAPRFLREGDEIELSAKISSLCDKNLAGKAMLTLTDPYTNQNITAQFGSAVFATTFEVKSGQNTSVSWKLKVPQGLSVITYRVIATAGNFSDGEEEPLPVLSNRMLVTETVPLHIKGGDHKQFALYNLLRSGSSTTLVNHKLTVEVSSNPAWYAIQSLPYMMEFPHECSEQLFNRFYANSIASHIARSTPRIQQIFNSWKGTDALQSNLEKNKDLKQLLLEETPWIQEGRDEADRKKRVGLLFDLAKMSNEQAGALRKLKENQSTNGGWSWFKGMPDDRYITQYIITGIGRLQSMGVIEKSGGDDLHQAAKDGIWYLDAKLEQDFAILKSDHVDMDAQNISDFQIQYLYARSFFKDMPLADVTKKAYDYYMGQARKYWLKQDKAGQAMIAIVMYRGGNMDLYKSIIKSLDENAVHNEELGMYWKDNVAGYTCFEAPVETQALMVEAFSLSGKNETQVNDLLTWLLKQKQVQSWNSTKSTADACYALLLGGSNWLNSTDVPDVTLGNLHVSSLPNQAKAEAGTGYMRTSFEGNDIKPAMGTIGISKQGKGIAWGAVYWQYFEQLDKITSAKTALQLDKKLFLQTNGPTGAVLTAITNNTELKPGDLVKVRIELRVDRDMDFVQMKDMRASGFEPTSTLSGYKYQDGQGYYESPRDASTNFFFDHLHKGTFVFEYALRVSQKGDFSNGVATIQSMYAPEFSAHSEGIRVVVK